MAEQKFFETSRKDILVLRLMIIIGLITMVIFFVWLLKPEHFGQTWLYYLLLLIMFFSALKVFAEWYHYFNIKIPIPPANSKRFSVDIFTTYCPGEPIEMIEETLTAIKAIKYPHESYLCDESDSPYLKEFCRKLGVHHVTRNNRIDAKAGNINNALKQSNGEICVILDPDHVPQPDFLDPIIPYFADPKIGFVQIVQAYKNIRESIVSRGAAQQTFQFYGPMMMTMNSYGTVLAIGANCTFRRKALESIGGHAPGLAEDMHTAMKLHAKGWKSVYVPKILARGLVPSSLYAYYKQQLKWSRGVFELLFTTYIKQFKNFTWAQKLHYGTLPFHYFSGVIYFLNFLIPILSLVFAVIPLKVDLIQFFLIGAPFFANTLLIRHYVQRWVMEETERGFHMIGGILQIGTWWVHALGFVYAILRKKVPYIPTPKNGEEGNNFLLNLPNIGVVAASLAAIVYGISIDYNPYTFIMAGLAGSNCLLMAFMLVAGQHGKISSFKIKYQTQKYTRGYVYKLRLLIWSVKHDIYALVRKVALPVSLLLTLFAFTYLNMDRDPEAAGKVVRKGSFYTGIFSPESTNGLTTLTAADNEEKNFNLNFDLISCYIPWGDNPDHYPGELINGIIDKGSIPFITWEPWVSTFSRSAGDEDLKNERNGLKHIVKGEFNDYICRVALTLKNLQSPVFLRFAHEPDNPAYPWSESGGNSAGDFVKSWKYVYNIFDSLRVKNVVWVWNPWKAENLKAYFPGEKYVDWIGITGLNYGAYNHNGKWYEFSDYYQSFANDSIFQKDLPVIVAEFGSLTVGGDQQKWISNALQSIKNKFPEIRGLVFFNSNIDKNLPEGVSDDELLNWRVLKPEDIKHEFEEISNENILISGKLPHTAANRGLNDIAALASTEGENKEFKDARGVNYRKGSNWFRNFYALTYREINADFKKIKVLGANTIKWCGPGIYDRNVLRAASANSLNIHYSFWIPNEFDFINDTEELADMANEILATVKKYKDNKNIKSWNIGNDVWQDLNNRYYKPDVFNQRDAFLVWLKKLVDDISRIDQRPVTLDVEVTDELTYKLEKISRFIPGIEAFGLMYKDIEKLDGVAETRGFPVFNSDIPASLLLTGEKGRGGFISSFQDLGTRDHVSFSGLVNHKGKLKEEYLLVQNKWTKKQNGIKPRTIRILKKAKSIEPGTSMKYYVLRRQGDQWDIVDRPIEGMEFHWHLVKTDGYGHGIYMEYLGKGIDIRLDPPEDYNDYELLLTADVGDYVIQTRTKLHTPLEGKVWKTQKKTVFKNKSQKIF